MLVDLGFVWRTFRFRDKIMQYKLGVPHNAFPCGEFSVEQSLRYHSFRQRGIGMTTPAENHRHKMDVEVAGSALDVHQLHDATIVVLGHHELTRQNEVTAVTERIRDALAGVESPTIVLDFRRVDAVGSVFLGELIALHKKLAAKGMNLRLAGVQPDVQNVIRITGLEDMLPVFPDVKAAVLAKEKRRWWWPFGK